MGLINLRGQIATAIDLRRLFGLSERPGNVAPMSVIVPTADGVVSLIVDQIGDVVEVDDRSFELPPETLAGVARELTTGVYKLPDGLLLVLDTARAVELPVAGRDGVVSTKETS
jgi:purine-binding chemotaxis protein CheW